MTRKFTCEHCNEEFVAKRPEEEVLAEMEELFPGLPEEDRVEVCDDCFIKIMEFNEPGELRYVKYIDKH